MTDQRIPPLLPFDIDPERARAIRAECESLLEHGFVTEAISHYAYEYAIANECSVVEAMDKIGGWQLGGDCTRETWIHLQIPPRPWRVFDDPHASPAYILDANGDEVLGINSLYINRLEHVVACVNAMPEVIAALEAALRALPAGVDYTGDDLERDRALVRAALLKVRP